MVREWKPMCTSKRERVFAVGDQPYFLAQVFIEAANDLKTNRIVSSYHVNRLTCLTSISIHRSRFIRNGQGGRPRTASRTRRRPRRGVAFAVNSVTINLHVSTMKFGLIGTTPMTWYSEISSHVLSIRTGTALALLDNFKTSSNPGSNTPNAAMQFS